MAKRQTVPVSTRALIQRVNRKLASRGEKVRATRGTNAQLSVGEYYILNITGNYVSRPRVDLEQLARDENALQPWESWDPSRG